MPAKTKLRIARPVTDISATQDQWTRGFGFTTLYSFNDHDGFDGVMIGHKDYDWHFEFTVCRTHAVKPSATEEDLVVLYFPSKTEWEAAVAQAESAGFKRVKSFNPYWDVDGVTLEDRDGYRVVIQNAEWSL
ncbi:hypothetical protein VHUM_02829 [Vanrija humicola]|uniref:VOC domain-containing protein n=1 Tax=Vanrija humicola TaxID=5417 RepID=A0A7D8YV68_VANHU|nr:hypothetical protein VHUM_02829 [Vanrija humicola]